MKCTPNLLVNVDNTDAPWASTLAQAAPPDPRWR